MRTTESAPQVTGWGAEIKNFAEAAGLPRLAQEVNNRREINGSPSAYTLLVMIVITTIKAMMMNYRTEFSVFPRAYCNC